MFAILVGNKLYIRLLLLDVKSISWMIYCNKVDILFMRISISFNYVPRWKETPREGVLVALYQITGCILEVSPPAASECPKRGT